MKNASDKKRTEEEKQPGIEVIVDSENQVAKFANSVKIWHTPYEFYMDFGQFIPGTNKIRVNARMVITPQHARSLYSALSENISKYEQRFGKIGKKGKDSGGKLKTQDEEANSVKRHAAEYVG